MSSSNSYKFIGQGTYGCVIKPPLKCNSEYKDIDYDNKVSKLMDEIEAHKEFVENDNIYKIKHIEKYVLPKPIICKPEISDENIRKMLDNELKKCTNLKDNFFNSKFKLLLLEDGGQDLDQYTKTYNSDKNPDRFTFERLPLIDKIEFFKSLIHLFDSIIFLRKNNLVHHDIKLHNIVYNTDTKKSFLIDFGLLATDDSIKDNSYEYSVSHSLYPPETSCVDIKNFISSGCKKYRDKISKDVKKQFPPPLSAPLIAYKKAYNEFVQKHIDTFDSYCLCLGLSDMIEFMYAVSSVPRSSLDVKTENILKNFYKKVYRLLEKYCNKDIFERASDLYYLRDQYIYLLQSFIDECESENLITENIVIKTKLPDELKPKSPQIIAPTLSVPVPIPLAPIPHPTPVASRKSKSISPIMSFPHPTPVASRKSKSISPIMSFPHPTPVASRKSKSISPIMSFAHPTPVASRKRLEKYITYTRKQLQSSAKKYGIKANQSNLRMIDELSKKSTPSPLPREEKYRNYTRKQLQSSAKKYGIKANQSNVLMREMLSRRPK